MSQTASIDAPGARGLSERATTAFHVFFWALAATGILWLLLGLASALAAGIDGFHDLLHDWGRGDAVLSQMARNIAQASHASLSAGEVLLDYLFSVVNIGLAIFLVLKGPQHLAARLLALALLGTAVAFNLQGHDARQVFPAAWIDIVGFWHNFLIHVLSGICYVLALLLFPDGRLMARRRAPYLLFFLLFAALLGAMSAGDHTFGLVVVFGFFAPIAGVTSQFRRYRRATDPEAKQQSRVLVWALALSLLVAFSTFMIVNYLFATGRLSITTKTYEFTTPAAGTYYFRCDPHPGEMRGTVRVVEDGAPAEIALAAEDIEFTDETLQLPARDQAFIRFTNRDADPHNVAIYRDKDFTDPVFVGAEFEGQNFTGVAFRVFRMVFLVIPVVLFMGLLRFRLWDIDKVINKTLVYGVLAGFITAVYVAVVAGISNLVGTQGRPNLLLSIIATAIVALGFEPLRERVQRFVNRVVYGKRATPYEVLSEFSERVAQTYATEDVLPRMARTVAEGTGAERAEVWLRSGNELRAAAAWPEEGATTMTLAMSDGVLPDIPHADKVIEVRHQGELLGALSVSKPPNEAFTPAEEQLLEDLAGQAGLVLRNVGLTAELLARLDELKASRQRLVAAQDQERRRLERNLHDGAQQHLVALKTKLGLAERFADDPVKLKRMLAQLKADADEALETLRDLARGIYPPLLADQGLQSALESQVRKASFPVIVEADGIGRYSQEVEAAVYFCCLEALQNVGKYAHASQAWVALQQRDTELLFSVRDDGGGFDVAHAGHGTGLQNMVDRIEALGGSLEIESVPGQGTVVRARIPADPIDAAAGARS